VHEPVLLVISKEAAGQRLDTFLASHFAEVSRSQVRRWIVSERVWVGDQPRKPGYQLSLGETVRVEPLAPAPTELVPENLPVNILYEDDTVIVVNKPAGMVVHPGAGNWKGTLANALAFHFQEMSGKESSRPGIVHRLDKGTSGILIIAKNEQVHDFLARQFQLRTVEKTYSALLYGRIEPSEGLIDLPIGRDQRTRTKISPRTRKPREAQTGYRVVEYPPGFSFVEAYPRTGRTHQIRVHFHHVGHPIVGDETYARKSYFRLIGPKQAKAIKQLGRLFLHASTLKIVHPETEKPMTFEAPLPPELAVILATLGK
jgi:23S rRNA pseudouridine1911/1915/1917 synthase